MQNCKRVIVSIVSLFLVAACSFHPMYGGHELNSKLRSVYVTPVNGQEAKRFRDMVEDALGADGAGREFELTVNYKKEQYPVLIDKDRGISRYAINMIAPYTLKEISSGRVIKSGEVSAKSGYNVDVNLYSTTILSESQEELLLKELARKIEKIVSMQLQKS